MLWMWLLTACGEGCLERDLELWCRHEESASGPTSEEPCDPPDYDPAIVEPACDGYEVDPGASAAFANVMHYFKDGEHVATAYTTDVNVYCGDFVYWYGKRVCQ